VFFLLMDSAKSPITSFRWWEKAKKTRVTHGEKTVTIQYLQLGQSLQARPFCVKRNLWQPGDDHGEKSTDFENFPYRI